MTEPKMASQTPRFVGQRLHPAWLGELGVTLGDIQLSVLDTGGKFNMVDTDPFRHRPTISFLNMATVRYLQRWAGLVLDPRRFRMNVWYDNDEPWSELAWANGYPGTREFDVGNIHFRIQDACERCEAINADPQTGERDLDLLPAIEAALKARGYRGSPHRGTFNVMGFLATPLSSGRLYRGQKIVMR